jgi:hypothetical protein
MSDFETWWYHEGSGPRLPGEDNEEHCKRMCKIAWSNGADKILDALQQIKQRLDTCHLHVLSGHEVFDSFYMELIDDAIASAKEVS